MTTSFSFFAYKNHNIVVDILAIGILAIEFFLILYISSHFCFVLTKIIIKRQPALK